MKEMDWIQCRNGLPPDGVVVETKIDDSQGKRNEQCLKRQGPLWFFPDGSTYVYYTPTHWRLKKKGSMKNHEEIHEEIATMGESDDTEERIAIILHALNDRIDKLENESASDYVELNERIRDLKATMPDPLNER